MFFRLAQKLLSYLYNKGYLTKIKQIYEEFVKELH